MEALKSIHVLFLPSGKRASLQSGESLLDACRQAGIRIRSSCDGEGVCGLCKVVVQEGDVEPAAMPQITEEERQNGVVLACLARPIGDITVSVPEESKLATWSVSPGSLARGDDAGQGDPLLRRPASVRLRVGLQSASLEDPLADWERIERGLQSQGIEERLQPALGALRDLGPLLRQQGWSLDLWVSRESRVQKIQEAGERHGTYGLAVDVGTTTVVAHLVDLEEGKALAGRIVLNGQRSFGEDVITRILHARKPKGMQDLREGVLSGIRDLVTSLCAKVEISPHQIVAATCAGNPTMTHILLGVNPETIRKEPYVPVANHFPLVEAREVEFPIWPHASVECVPGVASYVGGDITAGVLATGLADLSKASLLIDAGTNGEMVLGSSGVLVCCSCSAGPAFEGSGLSSGMVAGPGAIEKVKIEGDQVRVQVVGSRPPTGLCGTGFVDLLAELLRVGWIDRAGAISDRKTGSRYREGERGPEVLLVPRQDTGTGRDVVVSQADIDNLLRAKAALYAGLNVLLDKLEVPLHELDRVFVAGGFGHQLDVERAMAIGLLPDLPLERVTPVGNTSVEGAKRILLSQRERDRAAEIARSMTYIELSADPTFAEQFTAGLFLPHTDLSRFPHFCDKKGNN